MCTIATFDTEYGTLLPIGRRPATDAIFTMRPGAAALRWGIAAEIICQVPITLTSRTRCQTSAVTPWMSSRST